jgi:hypothetical protein
MGIRALLIGVLAAPAVALAAPGVATVTIADGAAVVIRESSKLALAEGVRLAKDDIVETGATGRLLRIEFADGTLLDLGPETRALVSPRLGGDKSRAASQVHLLSGAVKLTLPKGHAPATAVLSSPAFDVGGLVRSAVFLVQPTEAYAFAESGEVMLQERLVERGASKADAIFNLKGGEFFAHAAGAKATVTQRPTPAFIQRLPRPFLDALPARAALFKDREVEPKRLGAIGYNDVAAWLDADGLRAGFVTRWKVLAQDPEFRKGLVANLRAHPEWDRTLFPEKYLPKPKAEPAAGYGTKP